MTDCNKKLTFEEKELLLLRNAVDISEKKTGIKIKQSNNIYHIFDSQVIDSL